MKIFLTHLALVASLILLFGCAAISRPRVLTHSDAQFPLTAESKIAIADRTEVDPQTQQLRQLLRAALLERGVRVVEPSDAEFVLTFRVEDNSDVSYSAAKIPSGTYDRFMGATSQSPFAYEPAAGTTTVTYSSQGLRLQLFPARKTAAGLAKVWEGYIDAGETLKLSRAPALLRTLLNYFGQNFSGKVALVK